MCLHFLGVVRTEYWSDAVPNLCETFNSRGDFWKPSRDREAGSGYEATFVSTSESSNGECLLQP